MECVWCTENQASKATKDCHWIEPGGIAVIMVTGVPAIHCPGCRDTYLTDEMNEEIELALNTVDLDKLGHTFSYEQLMKAPKMSIFKMIENGMSFKCK